MTRPRIGERVSAIAYLADGGGRVRGVVLELRGDAVLLSEPHGRWVALRTVRVFKKRAPFDLVKLKARRQRLAASRKADPALLAFANALRGVLDLDALYPVRGRWAA